MDMMLKMVDINTFSVARTSSDPNLLAMTTMVAIQGMDASSINTFLAISPNPGNSRYVRRLIEIARINGIKRSLLKVSRKTCGFLKIP
jgi:hypothetical protein